ncbi:MAG TPA: BTAD domain-containing putative transcriptional regulator [Thermoleophilaceae bacterium]|jgi:DNA-binding SARP family transcriptional activator|nr:BTAD domain-containing putative transcriptional regulator [Thermoleophilaceae bacterium]
MLTIRLLGPPEIERDGVIVTPPRGHKSWAVLAYLVLAERPVARSRLAGLIFGDAADPLGALRWTLAELRRTLEVGGLLRGDPLVFELPEEAWVDVLALASGDPDPALARGGFLEGVDPGAGPDFDAWLLVERGRFAGLCEAVLRDAALEALATGAPRAGAALASRALALNRFEDAAHELLVRCLARAGEVSAAREHADACDALFRRELGRAPDPGVRRAVDEHGVKGRPAVGDRAAAVGQLEAGRAAVNAGAVEPGIACLRQACAEARGVDDPVLLGRALAALGAALVHLLRGGDEEGAAVLHEALALAEAVGDREVMCKVCRELGFVAVQAGRGVSAGRWLLRAGALADDEKQRASVLGVRGQALSDRAHYHAAIALLEQSVAAARSCGDVRQQAWSLAILGRALLLRDQVPDALEVLDESLALVEEEGWVAFQPFPEALRAEVALRQGAPDQAIALLDHAFPLGCRLGDPCWEAIAARARGLVYEAEGERVAALAWLRDAVQRAQRVADPYVWMHAWCLDALAGVAIADAAPEAGELVSQLETLAARGDMRELVVRAALHRASLGAPGALESARLLGEAIDNPALHAGLAAAA